MMREFLNSGIEVAERILGLGDRRDGSIHSGCYDRMYWKYKLIDYPSSWFQAASEYLACLYYTADTIFYKSTKVEKWCFDACRFTLSNLNKDGSCIEVYPFERSFCSTSFILGYICAAYLKFNQLDTPKEMIKIGNFLNNNFAGKVSNQLAASALAQFRLAKLTNRREFHDDARNKLNLLYANQTKDGYFHEYGGLDIGYLSITLSLLARIENEFPYEVDKNCVHKAIKVIDSIVKDDGTYDSSLMSRGTQFLYPYGLAYWGSPVMKKLEKGLKAGKVIKPSWLDDRYVINLAIDYIYASNWLEAS
ncbi:hypothetical protein MCHI_003409 [Candidatus Magnetoovum chiemensis]|nr:hypothetical protein MCHI_003409 [Candidatus Magnetoovum chiemensis]